MLRLRRTPNNFQFYPRGMDRNVSSRLPQAENRQYNKRDGPRDREAIERQEIFTPNVTGNFNDILVLTVNANILNKK